MPENEDPAITTEAATVKKGIESAPGDATEQPPAKKDDPLDQPEVDEFGLPIRRKPRRPVVEDLSDDDGDIATRAREEADTPQKQNGTPYNSNAKPSEHSDTTLSKEKQKEPPEAVNGESDAAAHPEKSPPQATESPATEQRKEVNGSQKPEVETAKKEDSQDAKTDSNKEEPKKEGKMESHTPGHVSKPSGDFMHAVVNEGDAQAPAQASEYSHQALTTKPKEENKEEELEWQEMPSYASYDMYNDDGRLVAKEARDSDDEVVAYGNLGGAGKGYTRVQIDEDAQSATSMDENTAYLFKERGTDLYEDQEARDPLSQMQATKDLLTEGQRIAYVGLVRLAMIEMTKEVSSLEKTKGSKKQIELASEAMAMWSQKMMVRLYGHMEIESAEQIMIEQLAEHGVQPPDLTPPLMQNARVKNPVANDDDSTHRSSVSSPRPTSHRDFEVSSPISSRYDEPGSPPPYRNHEGEDLPEVRMPSQLPKTTNLDIDLRWTVLCDLFLVLIADSIYDARSRQLLEKVGSYLDVPWLEICRFEKRVIDALEMQEAANKENWNENEHMENRKKMARNRRLVMMGLATVGGGLVIGLSAGLLAPVIGAGLAAGFTTIGVAGTSTFLGGAGAAALITTTGVAAGGTIGVRAASRRTGAVKTFEYRPLHNNKRVNLIVTVAGWMNGKVDDVRLPYSTVDPIMGDIYSVFWEPEMLQSMGDTINILATEALTQGLQQILGSTILIALMASLQAPIVLTKLAYLIDNPWSVSLARADAAGLILADSLIDRNLGVRPVTLVGFSLGSRLIFSCLKELARKGAFGLVQNVYLFGSPLVAKKDEYLKARSVVTGRFVNGYATNDWILGYLFRATSGGVMRVAGLAKVEVDGIENFDVTKSVAGHMAYRAAMPRLLRECGWVVESDEFTEIEDPDPDNHEKRQRELINEIEEARRELEKKPKKRFSFFRSKKTERKEWEMYDDNRAPTLDKDGEPLTDGKEAVLFDIDAIRSEAAQIAAHAEMSAHGVEVKQLESTLPPLKLDLASSSSDPRSSLRETKSYNDSLGVNGQSTARKDSTPKLPTSYEYDEYDEFSHSGNGEITMTFDEPSYSAPRAASRSPYLESRSSFNPSERSWDPAERPPLTSAHTTPALSSAQFEHNAWADEFDDEFGKEKEIKMTFA